jgi:hypothetical protein
MECFEVWLMEADDFGGGFFGGNHGRGEGIMIHGGVMEEELWRRNHGRGIVEKSWTRNHDSRWLRRLHFGRHEPLLAD